MSLAQTSKPFLDYLDRLPESWEVVTMEELVGEQPYQLGIVGVDIVKGFCDQGVLASPRVRTMVPQAQRIVEKAHQVGVTDFFFACDAHPSDSPEFAAFPPHCLEGTAESELVEELARLPYANEFVVLPKRSINGIYGTHLHEALLDRPRLRTLLVVGDCTDLCVYQMASGLRLLANVHHHPWEIMVVASAVETYDLPVEAAEQLGAMPHDAEFLHRVFLYHLQLNGVRVVADVI